LLALYITSSGWGSTPTHNQQQTTISKGSGTFTLKHKFVTGWPHVSFYGGGSCFGGVYFGQGDSVLEHKGWSYKQADGKGATITR
jgi:hypothetical protein